MELMVDVVVELSQYMERHDQEVQEQLGKVIMVEALVVLTMEAAAVAAQGNGGGNNNKVGGTGGAGTQNDINGTSTYYGAGPGGLRGYSSGAANGTNGTGWSTTRAQTGHGGGYGAGVGGSGVIILKYLATFTATFSSGVVQSTGQISWNGALYNVYNNRRIQRHNIFCIYRIDMAHYALLNINNEVTSVFVGKTKQMAT